METFDEALQYFQEKNAPETTPVSVSAGGDVNDFNSALAYFANRPKQETQMSILPQPETITQRFGNYNPGVEVFSKGRALGTNISANVGTPVAVPPGDWTVTKTFTEAKRGYIGDNENSGYGNSIKLKNNATGEQLHFTHLSKINVMPGQQIQGSTVIGNTGATGNVTGPHLNLEYYDPQGQLGDVLTSSYGRYLLTK